MPFLRWFFDEVIPNVIANLLADVFSPASMTGWLFALGTIVWVAVNWNRRQRAANKPGMASWPFIAVCSTIAILAVAGAAYGLGLRYAVSTTTSTAAPNGDGPIDLFTGKKIAAADPYPELILTTRYYSKKNKEDIADILDKMADTFNKQGRDALALAETAINNSPWDRPGEDIAPMIERLQHIEALTTDFRRDLFEVLYRDYPDYRIELNKLLFPQEPPSNFQGGAKNFANALVVWKDHRDGLEGTDRQQFADLVNTARFAFGNSRQEFLKWQGERETKVTQTRMALQQ